MTLKIERNSDGRRTLIRLIGRVRSEHIEELKKQTGVKGASIVFDMECVTLVDIEVVRFLNACEKSGIELIHCSPYILKSCALHRDTEIVALFQNIKRGRFAKHC